MSIPDQDRYGILQPIPEPLLDKEFRLDGWKIKDAKTGTLVKKERHHEDADLQRCVELREDIRIGWTVARDNSVTMTKIAFPIIFLFLLNYYTTFLPYKDSNISIGILTTIFLSGIALYFSTEKPQPLKLTTIDLIFIYYYFQVGITALIIGLAGLINETIFNYCALGLKLLLPISLLFSALQLYIRITSVRLKPRMGD
jgi:hypothetical protein